MRLKKFVIPCLLTVLLLVSAGIGVARENNNAAVQTQMLKPTGTPVRTLLNINLLAHWIYADGTSAHDPNTNGSGVIFPRGTYGAGVIYTDGLVWGGFVKDGASPELRVGGTTYNTGLQRGAIVSKGVAEDPNAPDVRLWRIRPDYKTADLKRDAAELQDAGLTNITDADVAAVRAQYETDWNEWPWQKGAPFYDTNKNGVMDGDETPGFAGADQVVWFTSNDLNSSQCFQIAGSPPIGMEVQVTLWGYNRTDALGNVAFRRFRFIYKGTSTTPADATIDSMFVAVFSDPDLGDYSTDYVGCDTTAGLGFVYNSVTQDSKFVPYNLAPPSAGYDFLQGPIYKTNNPDDEAIFKMKKVKGSKNFGMTGFLYFASGTSISDPDLKVYDGTLQWYNLMNGLLPRAGTPFLDNYGNVTKFPLSGDPVAGDYNIDGVLMSASDRRFGMVTGPINMAVGDTQEVVVALLTGLGADRLSSLSVLKYNDISAQYAFDNLFELAKAPAQPKLKVINLENKIVLNWSWDSESVAATEAEQKGYMFEGYNVYQLPTAASTKADAKLIATFDVKNEITTIIDSKFDEASGLILQLPVQIGKNSGVKRNLAIERDAFTDRPLVNGRRYYFAVTAYSYNGDPNVPIHSLESSLSAKTAIPQMPNPGVRYTNEVGDAIPVVHYGTSAGATTVSVVDPTELTDHTYNVIFQKDEATGETTWSLIDSTLQDTVFSRQTDQSGKSQYIDGLQVGVKGPNPGIDPARIGVAYGEGSGDSQTYLQGWDFTSPRWIGGRAKGWPGLFGGLGSGEVWLGSNITAGQYVDCEIRFAGISDASGLTTVEDLMAKSKAENPERWSKIVVFDGWGTWDTSVGDAPFSAWNMETDPPTRLKVAMVEDAAGTSRDNIWDMGWDPATQTFQDGGAYEYFFVILDDYDEDYTDYLAGGSLYDNPFGGWTVMYSVSPQARGTHPYLEGEFEINVFAAHINTPNDMFSFSPKGVQYTKENALADVEKIKAYPNPYYGINPRETTNVDKFVSFNHLPQKATINIFNLAGQLVNTIEKDDPSQFMRWNLRNHNDLPVASGIYIIRIDMPEIGKVKVLKLSLVQQQQFLEIF